MEVQASMVQVIVKKDLIAQKDRIYFGNAFMMDFKIKKKLKKFNLFDFKKLN